MMPINTSERQKISSDDVKRIISCILSHCNSCNGTMVPARGTITNVAKKFRVSKQAVSRIWSVAKINNNKPEIAAYTASPVKRGPKVGCCLYYDRTAVSDEIALLKSNQRRTVRSIASSTGISHATIHRLWRK
jgi:DNA invertase Pin-like site-specific DNA recombinase